MQKTGMIIIGGLLGMFTAGPVLGEMTHVTQEDWDALHGRLGRLEKALEPLAQTELQKPGEPTWYEKMDVGFGATGVLQGAKGEADGSVACDLDVSMMIEPSERVNVRFEAGAGRGMDGRLATFSGFNATAGYDPGLKLAEAWHECAWLEERLRMRGGKLDLSAYFDANAIANSETEHFLSGGFVNNVALEFPEENGLSAILWFAPHDLWSVGVAAGEADADWMNVFAAVFAITEIDFKSKVGERVGHYRIYGWVNSRDHVDLEDLDKRRESNYGVGVSLDQEFTEGVAVFARYGRQRASVAQVGQAWSAGIQYSGNTFQREEDTLGVAFGMAYIGHAWNAFEQANGCDLADELHGEIYYNVEVNKHLYISPDVQWVRNPNGEKDHADVWVWGVRTHITF